jgi:hypothetical protein
MAFHMDHTEKHTVDAETGQLISYQESRFGPEPKPTEEELQNKISAEEAKDNALELLHSLYTDATEELKLMMHDPSIPVKLSEDRFDFWFQRFYQGHPIEGDGVNITLNPSGKLSHYDVSRTSGLSEKLNELESVRQQQ